MHNNLEISTCDPLKHNMDYPILIVSICLGKSIRMKRVKQLPALSKVHLQEISGNCIVINRLS